METKEMKNKINLAKRNFFLNYKYKARNELNLTERRRK